MTFFTILILSGAGFVLWWGVESTKRFCNSSDCCERKYRWKCRRCGDLWKSNKQPYCKICMHVERINIRMEKIND